MKLEYPSSLVAIAGSYYHNTTIGIPFLFGSYDSYTLWVTKVECFESGSYDNYTLWVTKVEGFESGNLIIHAFT